MSLLVLPAELRSLIFGFCFPPPKTHVQLIPYRALAPQCHLNLPLSLYLVCKSFYADLPLLSSKLRSLDFTYIIQGAMIARHSRPKEHGPRTDDDRDLSHFQKRMEHAERVRLVGESKNKLEGRSLQSAPRRLSPGSKCALRVLEVQPYLWKRSLVSNTLVTSLALLISHPDVVERLRISLIKESVGEVKYLSEKGLEMMPSTSDEEEEECAVYERESPNPDMDEIEDLLVRIQNAGKAALLSRSLSTTTYAPISIDNLLQRQFQSS